MILQRRTHRLPEWRNLLYKLAIQLDYPQFLPSINTKYKNLREDVQKTIYGVK